MLEKFDASTPIDEQATRMFVLWDAYIKSCNGQCHLDSDLIFVPLLFNGHYCCVCINFISHTIDFLCNTTHQHWESSDFLKLCKIVVSFFFIPVFYFELLRV
ncbi:hypothetical protein RND81_01G111100 [Saponaria officinalis]|uniref:Ubiquitin-like protease family profile domain-containing protein n=1 Tax=Saponaria officinalis TaxID=3572 RepID=A0AAW1N9E7_SAPOF